MIYQGSLSIKPKRILSSSFLLSLAVGRLKIVLELIPLPMSILFFAFKVSRDHVYSKFICEFYNLGMLHILKNESLQSLRGIFRIIEGRNLLSTLVTLFCNTKRFALFRLITCFVIYSCNSVPMTMTKGLRTPMKLRLS